METRPETGQTLNGTRNGKAPRVAIYARVSTTKQSTENQVPVLTQWCQQRGWEIVATYQEEESAWHSGHQPELAKLTEAARQSKFDCVAIWALDRLTREGALAILQKVDRFKKYGVRIFSYQEAWTEAPGELAEVLFAIAGWVARMESHRRSERTKAGLLRAKQEGNGRRGPDQKKRVRRWRRRPGVTE